MASSTTAELAKQLADSHSSTIYVDADLDNVSDADLLAADPPLHVERDLVRDLWAVRAATEDEVAEALAAKSAPAAPAPAPAKTTSKT